MKSVFTRAVPTCAALLVALALLPVSTNHALAQDAHTHAPQSQQQELSPEQSQLLSIVRDATERFKNVATAQSEQYSLLFGCVTGPASGAMGLHFVKQEYLTKPPMLPNGDIDPTFVITHEMPLDDAPHGYRIFRDKQDNCEKIVLHP